MTPHQPVTPRTQASHLIINGPKNVTHVQRSLKVNNTADVKIMYANIRGLKGKRSSLIEQLAAEKPHFFLLTETLLTTDSDIQLDGYIFFGRARRGKLGGGVAILVRNDIRNLVVPHISDREIEMIWVSYRQKKNKS